MKDKKIFPGNYPVSEPGLSNNRFRSWLASRSRSNLNRYARIEAIRERGATILFVSHSARAIVELCDRAILINAGEKLAMGLPKQIVGMYQTLIYASPEKREELIGRIRKGQELLPAEAERPGGARVAEKPGQDVLNDDLESFEPDLKPTNCCSLFASKAARHSGCGFFVGIWKVASWLSKRLRFNFDSIVLDAQRPVGQIGTRLRRIWWH